jgi:hypothetical protein
MTKRRIKEELWALINQKFAIMWQEGGTALKAIHATKPTIELKNFIILTNTKLNFVPLI